MRRLLLLTGLLLFPALGLADMIAPNPTPLRLALAPVSLVGTVTRIEEKPIFLTRYPGDPQKVAFQVAVVQVDRNLAGVEGKTHVRVAFPQPIPRPVEPNLPPLPRPRLPGPRLEQEQQAMLFLRPHDQDTVLVAADPFGFVIATGNPGFKGEVAEAEKTARLLAKPLESLRSDDKATRTTTAVLLLHRYTQGAAGKVKQVALEAEESKLILTALAEADWAPNQPGRFFQLEPQQAFMRLRLTPADGWTQPQQFKDFPAAARRWLTDHVGTYRIQRTVPAEP